MANTEERDGRTRGEGGEVCPRLGPGTHTSRTPRHRQDALLKNGHEMQYPKSSWSGCSFSVSTTAHSLGSLEVESWCSFPGPCRHRGPQHRLKGHFGGFLVFISVFLSVVFLFWNCCLISLADSFQRLCIVPCRSTPLFFVRSTPAFTWSCVSKHPSLLWSVPVSLWDWGPWPLSMSVHGFGKGLGTLKQAKASFH